MFLFPWAKKRSLPKVNRLTQREAINQIEALVPGESLSYRLPETYGNRVVTVEFSMDYPWRGTKYILKTQIIKNGELAMGKEMSLESNDARDLAVWLLQQRGKLLNTSNDRNVI